jgi:hypothetical protein
LDLFSASQIQLLKCRNARNAHLRDSLVARQRSGAWHLPLSASDSIAQICVTVCASLPDVPHGASHRKVDLDLPRSNKSKSPHSFVMDGSGLVISPDWQHDLSVRDLLKRREGTEPRPPFPLLWASDDRIPIRSHFIDMLALAYILTPASTRRGPGPDNVSESSSSGF